MSPTSKAPVFDVALHEIVLKRAGELWISTDEGWQTYSGARGTTAPLDRMGKPGRVYDGTIDAYYPDIETYAKHVRDYHRRVRTPYGLSLPPTPELHEDQTTQYITTNVRAEDMLLGKGAATPIEFVIDTMRKYLLWSIPLHIGRKMQRENSYLTLADISGEEAAQQKAERGEGYMMKQTLQHIEALTAIAILQGDEALKAENVVSQYGDVDNFDMSRVDPLHTVREPVSHDRSIAVLKAIDEAFKDVADGNLPNEALGELISIKLNKQEVDPIVYDLLAPALRAVELNENEPLEKVHIELKKYVYSITQTLLDEITKVSPKTMPLDSVDEVTRAPRTDLVDKRNVLLGGRATMFGGIWGPKSESVMERASRRRDGIASHGVLYHGNPANTVQATEEFPTYLKIMKAFKKAAKDPYLVLLYEQMIQIVEIAHSSITSVVKRGDTQPLRELAMYRAPQLAVIEWCNVRIASIADSIRQRVEAGAS
ncbi:MAG: hypothetical protein H0X39_05160 [Actinobacteria bacterium]|nr:hypothetical protein [Actinomycetota bacterium]